MTDTLPDKEVDLKTETEPQEVMEDKNDLFVSAMDSPSDSGLETHKTSPSDTMEDLSLQDDKIQEPPATQDINLEEEDLGVSEVNLDDDDDDDEDIFKSTLKEQEDGDIFKSTLKEQEEPMVTNGQSNGGSTREASMEPAVTDIPLEDDDEVPFENAHLKPGLQLQSEPALIPQQTLTSFREEEETNRDLEASDEFIEITVTSPHKVGDGMSSYMAYKVVTKTNLSYFKKNNPEVNRRFSDFLGLREKLCEKYLQNGRIIPPCPDKSVIGMTKVKMSKEDESTTQTEFVEKRRAALERYLNRTASHPNLRVDPDFREFLELDAELPKANQTSTLSGKSVMRAITKLGDKVSQYATKMEETDSWFEDKTNIIENLDTQLRKLLLATDAMVEFRKGLSGQTYQLSKSLRLLGSAEDNTKLAAALQQLADVEEKVEKVHEQQAKDDFFLLSELIHDYIGIVGAVRDAFNERVKAWQSWQTVQRELTRRREHKAKAELAGKTERVMQLRQEIAENERQLDMAQENFEKISRIIKKEFETFDVKKCKDFKDTITLYLENMLKSQETLVTHWERFLPEIKNMEL